MSRRSTSTSSRPRRSPRSVPPDVAAVVSVMSYEDSVLVALGDQRSPTAWSVLTADEAREMSAQMANAASRASEFGT